MTKPQPDKEGTRPLSLVKKAVYMTPVETRMFNMLLDGGIHNREELSSCLWDELGDSTNIRRHIRKLREKLAPHGYLIVCEYHRMSYYYRLCLHVSNVVIV